MKRFHPEQYPLKPATVVFQLLQFWERTALVHPGVVRELRALDEREYDRVLEAVQNATDPVEGEGISRVNVVLAIHGQMWC